MSQNNGNIFIAVSGRLHRRGYAIVGQRVGIAVGQNSLREVADLYEMLLQGSDIDVSKNDVVPGRHG